ncbi:hypothetical protein [Planctomycetes bacterium K23_9]|uniref:Uncharacterized protein n=1 Tax=Stieleria marina TaxID=1930275 RepID=A0A517NMI0_9BACT|nr:hypothetical protein K239x_02790 [Planctomycetes bacterium K23_9]
MYLLPCPHCKASIEVMPSQAGDVAICSECQANVPIPKLGELRQLPTAEDSTVDSDRHQSGGDVSGLQVVAVILGLLALAGLLIGGFAAIRWFLLETPITSEIHIAKTKEAFEGLNAARLIREFEHMEKSSLDLVAMYDYKTKALEKRRWGLVALIASGLGLFAAVIALKLASTRRTAKS